MAIVLRQLEADSILAAEHDAPLELLALAIALLVDRGEMLDELAAIGERRNQIALAV